MAVDLQKLESGLESSHLHHKGCCGPKEVDSTRIPIKESLTIWEAAQHGNLKLIEDLISRGMNTVFDKDEGNVTILHWAAINNHCHIANFLLDRGVEVDCIGGELQSTPLHWAARSGNVEMAVLLTKRGADPLIKDNQEYNAFHLAVHAGQTMMVVYFLSSGVPVDTRDGMQRTGLMWAAYQGSSIECMMEMLRNNPEIDTIDETGYTALHWAVISQHYEFAACLLKAGASHTIKDPAGKSPEDWAIERKTEKAYRQLLAEHKTGIAKKFGNGPFSDSTVHRILYSLPWILTPLMFLIFGKMAFYYAIPTAGLILFTVSKIIVAKGGLGVDPSKLNETPIMLSILHSTLFLNFISWLRMVPTTNYLYWTHTLYLLFYFGAVFSAFKTTFSNPGRIDKSTSMDAKQELVSKLAEDGKLNNLGQVVNLEDGYDGSKMIGTCIFGEESCTYLLYDYWTSSMFFWTIINVIWVAFLCAAQLGQIISGLTTNEAMNSQRFEYLLHPDDKYVPIYRKRSLNPFNVGPIANLTDFWTNGSGKLKNISWFTIYEVPLDLLASALRVNGYTRIKENDHVV